MKLLVFHFYDDSDLIQKKDIRLNFRMLLRRLLLTKQKFVDVVRHVSTVQLNECFLGSPHSTEKFVSTLRPYFELEIPIKVVCGQNHFAATEKWTLEYLVESIGSNIFDAEVGRSMNGTKVTISFEQYAQYLYLCRSSNDNNYLTQENLLYMAQNDLPSQLQSDVEVPKVCVGVDPSISLGAGKLYSTMLWIGPRGCMSRLHYDPMNNFLMQIQGNKRVFLIDKKVDSNMLYCGHEFQQQYNVSAIENVEDPDIHLYPNFQAVSDIFTTDLHPGDILFIPKKWWHATRSLEYSISVNSWWR